MFTTHTPSQHDQQTQKRGLKSFFSRQSQLSSSVGSSGSGGLMSLARRSFSVSSKSEMSNSNSTATSSRESTPHTPPPSLPAISTTPTVSPSTALLQFSSSGRQSPFHLEDDPQKYEFQVPLTPPPSAAPWFPDRTRWSIDDIALRSGRGSMERVRPGTGGGERLPLPSGLGLGTSPRRKAAPNTTLNLPPPSLSTTWTASTPERKKNTDSQAIETQLSPLPSPPSSSPYLEIDPSIVPFLSTPSPVTPPPSKGGKNPLSLLPRPSPSRTHTTPPPSSASASISTPRQESTLHQVQPTQPSEREDLSTFVLDLSATSSSVEEELSFDPPPPSMGFTSTPFNRGRTIDFLSGGGGGGSGDGEESHEAPTPSSEDAPSPYHQYEPEEEIEDDEATPSPTRMTTIRQRRGQFNHHHHHRAETDMVPARRSMEGSRRRAASFERDRDKGLLTVGGNGYPRSRKRSTSLNYGDEPYSSRRQGTGIISNLGPRTRRAFEAAGLLDSASSPISPSTTNDSGSRRYSPEEQQSTSTSSWDRDRDRDRPSTSMSYQGRYSLDRSRSTREPSYRYGGGGGVRQEPVRASSSLSTRLGEKLGLNGSGSAGRLTPSSSVGTVRTGRRAWDREKEREDFTFPLRRERERERERERGRDSPTTTTTTTCSRRPTPPTKDLETDILQSKLDSLEQELASLKTKHASEIGALLSALGDSQTTVRELRTRISTLEKEAKQHQQQQQKRGGLHVRRRAGSETDSVFSPIPEGVSQIIEDEGAGVLEDVTIDVDGGDGERTPSPTLVQQQQESLNTFHFPKPPTSPMSTKSQHRPNTSISSSVGSWDRETSIGFGVGETGSLKLRPEHEQFLGDVSF